MTQETYYTEGSRGQIAAIEVAAYPERQTRIAISERLTQSQLERWASKQWPGTTVQHWDANVNNASVIVRG